MSDEYWKVEECESEDGTVFFVSNGDGFGIEYNQELFAVPEDDADATSFRALAESLAHYANHLGIRPPAPVVELPSLFLRDYVLDGDIVREKVTGGAYVKREYVKQLRAMLSALDPEPQGPWVVNVEPLTPPEVVNGKYVIRFGGSNTGWSGGTDIYGNGLLDQKYRRMAHAIAREANRIEAERKGDTQ